MKALITGCDGFVGRHFTKYLKDMGWEVYGLDNAQDPDQDAFDYFLDRADEQFDLVVHCAYEVGGRGHIDGSNMALATNVLLDAALFKWALRTNQSAVLYFSSSAAYPKQYQSQEHVLEELENGWGDTIANLSLWENWIDLSSPQAPDANYGWAKLTGEKLAKAASEQGLRVHVVRPFSGYAEDQSLAYPFPSIIKRASQGDYTVWGPKGQARDWIHIEDCIAGAFAVYEADQRLPVNLCTGRATTMGDLMSIAVGREVEIEHLTDKPTGVYYRVGDPTRMNELYTATISLEEGVERAWRKIALDDLSAGRGK
jgi:nucleoside-diphosphate-sugar epimerase